MSDTLKGRIRARETLELLLARGLEQWQVLQKMRFALSNGIVRCRVQFAVVGADEFRDWDAPRSVWAASIMESTLSLRLDEYTANPGATPAHPGKVTLAGLSFDLADMRKFFEIDLSELPEPIQPKRSPDSARSQVGRKAGQVTYLGDAGIVERAILLCDNERLPLAKAIARLLPDIEPLHLEDASKKRRIRDKVLQIRPDLRGD